MTGNKINYFFCHPSLACPPSLPAGRQAWRRRDVGSSVDLNSRFRMSTPEWQTGEYWEGLPNLNSAIVFAEEVIPPRRRAPLPPAGGSLRGLDGSPAKEAGAASKRHYVVVTRCALTTNENCTTPKFGKLIKGLGDWLDSAMRDIIYPTN